MYGQSSGIYITTVFIFLLIISIAPIVLMETSEILQYLATSFTIERYIGVDCAKGFLQWLLSRRLKSLTAVGSGSGSNNITLETCRMFLG